MTYRRHPLAALAVAAAFQPACSFVFIERAPTKHKQMRAFDCTSSVTTPVLDTIWAGLNGIGAAVALSQSDRDYAGRTPDRGTTIGVGLAWLAVSGASAIYGFTQTRACRSAKDDLYTRLSEQRLPEPGPGIAIPASAITGACQKDTDCKGTRICEANVCVDPKPPQ
jgi:hypothetical protein